MQIANIENFNPVQRAFAVKAYMKTKSFKMTISFYTKQFNIMLKNQYIAVDVPSEMSILRWVAKLSKCGSKKDMCKRLNLC